MSSVGGHSDAARAGKGQVTVARVLVKVLAEFFFAQELASAAAAKKRLRVRRGARQMASEVLPVLEPLALGTPAKVGFPWVYGSVCMICL